LAALVLALPMGRGQESMGKPWPWQGNPMGKPWENHGKEIPELSLEVSRWEKQI